MLHISPCILRIPQNGVQKNGVIFVSLYYGHQILLKNLAQSQLSPYLTAFVFML